jgi:hypothetical protein
VVDGPVDGVPEHGLEGGVVADGVVGDAKWSVSLHAMSATLETQVGLQFVV